MAKGRLKKIGRRFFNPSKWMSVDTVASNAEHIKDSYKKFFVVDKNPVKEETFEEALQRLKITETMIQERRILFYRFSIFFLILSIGMFIYTIYCFTNVYIQAGLISLGICCALVGFAFKYNFWSFQIKRRKLGCTFEEWLHEGLLGKSKNKRLGN
ncbi:MAG: hypothetical protein HRT87_07165 [Legionellales bacterium]|nr:hypothetical protein [Legionellales bacterium]